MYDDLGNWPNAYRVHSVMCGGQVGHQPQAPTLWSAGQKLHQKAHSPEAEAEAAAPCLCCFPSSQVHVHHATPVAATAGVSRTHHGISWRLF